MSLIGKSTTGFRKQEYAESRRLAKSVKTLKFAHSATKGDTQINLTALTAPSDMTSNGFVNPSVAELAGAQLAMFRHKLTIRSTLRGVLEDYMDYVVSGSMTINFVTPFQAEEGEIFIGVIDSAVRSAIEVVDGYSMPATGSLALGATDFNTGFTYEVNKYPSTQMGAVMVFRNGKIQVRNEGNISSGAGNYYEVAVLGGYSTIIRFNTAGITLPDGSLESVMVVPVGQQVLNRTDGMLAMLETLGASQDKIASVLADATGLPISTFQSNPNNVNLRQFGDTVTSLQTKVSTAPTVQRFLSGSGNYVPSASVKYIRVRMVGGGGGGAGSGSAAPGNGGNGGNTTFGSFLTANGGGGGNGGSGGGVGGTATISSGVGIALQGGGGQGSSTYVGTVYVAGSQGGCSAFGGNGFSLYYTAGQPAAVNSGSGGGGGGTNGAAGSYSGTGGGAGGFIDVILSGASLLPSFAWSVGAKGTGGTAGTSGFAGGDGGAGMIIVEEFYS